MKILISISALYLIAFTLNAAQFIAPNDEQELKKRMDELRTEYAPYLRSLPEKMDLRKKTSLNGDWKFVFEVKDPPKKDTPPPPAPDWFGADFNDSGWETTTVPEWRYRTVGHDNVYNRTVDSAKIDGNNRNTSQICWYRRTFEGNRTEGNKRMWMCFDGVAWEAQVYVNGELIGSHRVYHEPFRFDVTDKIKDGRNTLAVRVINGSVYGEPMWAWTIFPDIRAEQQRYTPNRSESIKGHLPIGYHCGAGFGIWRDVYLESTAPVCVGDIFVRNDLSNNSARIKIEMNSASARSADLKVQIMPENCDGVSYNKSASIDLPAGESVHDMIIPMPDAKIWSPEKPNLYRCRVTVDKDVRDVLFGCRSFTIVNRKYQYQAPVYGFSPVKAGWLKIVGRASDTSTWNSIWEVDGKSIVRGPNAVTASGAQKEYPPAMALDGRQDTRWAVDGNAWIQFRLDPAIEFDRLTVGWYEAHLRKWDFDLMVSNDGTQWTKLDYLQTNADTAAGLPNGMLMLNGKPCYLRGSNINGFNAYAYWGETDKLVNAILLLKAGHFNSLRVCQHVQMPEVREMLDRLGIMTEQDQGAGGYGRLPTGIVEPHYLQATKALTRITYNNPGVVLLSLGNEDDWPTADAVRTGLAVDPQRIYVPISGRFTHSRKPWDLPEELRNNAIDDGHPYSGWYGHRGPPTWTEAKPMGPGRMITLGEYGAEAMDSYETMLTYPDSWKPPAKETDTLWASSQINKHDAAMLYGLTRNPTNLGEYIEASQKYQESLMADKTIGFRMSKHRVAGYFHFHFMDVIPVFWPKAIVSHDHRPKKAYYAMAQINQPVVALPQFTGKQPDGLNIWVCNDLSEKYAAASVVWKISWNGKVYAEGSKPTAIPAVDAVKVETIDLRGITTSLPEFDIELVLKASDGSVISTYRRNMHCLPGKAIGQQEGSAVDPFSKKK